MHSGAFGLVDCLGFKGVWKRFEEQDVMDRLLAIEREIRSELSERQASGQLFDRSIIDDGTINWNVSFLSDSVAIGAQWKPERAPKQDAEALLVDCVGIALERITQLYIEEIPNLVMRGCVTYGSFEINGSFIVGPAVDAAAESMNLAEGAFVWLHKSAQTPFHDWKLVLLGQKDSPFGDLLKWTSLSDRSDWFAHCNHFMAYPVPMKNGMLLEAYVLNPLARCTTDATRKSMIEKYRRSMDSNDPSVQIKQQNTLKMLQSAADFTARYYESVTS